MFASGRLTQQYIRTAAAGCHWTGRRIPECLTLYRVRFSDVVWMSPSTFCDVTRHRFIDVSGHYETFALLRCYAARIGSCSSTFRDTIGPIFQGSSSQSSWTALNTLTVALYARCLSCVFCLVPETDWCVVTFCGSAPDSSFVVTLWHVFSHRVCVIIFLSKT
jgi:hypothetical protein